MSRAAPPLLRRGGRLPSGLRMACLLVVLLAGCRVDAGVTITVDGRGGEVAVRFEADAAALAVLGGPEVVRAGAEATDLRRAGWEVEPPRITDRGAAVEARKRFARPEELPGLVAELAGPEGPLAEFRLTRRRGLTRTAYRLTGRVDLTDPGRVLAGIGNDPALAERLEDAGVDAARVAELLAERAEAGLRLALTVDLPGEDPVRVEASPGETVSIDEVSRRPDRVRPLLLLAAVVLGLGAVAVLRR